MAVVRRYLRRSLRRGHIIIRDPGIKRYCDRDNLIDFSPLEENMDSKLAILLIVVAAVAGYFVADNMVTKRLNRIRRKQQNQRLHLHLVQRSRRLKSVAS